MSRVYKIAERYVLVEKDTFNRPKAKRSEHSTKINQVQNLTVRRVKNDREKYAQVTKDNNLSTDMADAIL